MLTKNDIAGIMELASNPAHDAIVSGLKDELAEAKDTVAWYSSLVTRAQIGTAQTPCLKSYIEQLEAELAQHKSAVDEAR